MSVRELLVSFVGAYPAQPATAFWRAVEIDTLVRCGLPEGRGLDLGCGDGILTDILLRQTGSRVLVGVDSDPDETKSAARFSFYEAVHTCSSAAIPEPDASFDFILSNSVLEHIPALEATFAEMRRLLRHGGQFVFTIPGPGFHRNLRGNIFSRAKREAYLEKLDRRLAHYHYLSESDLATLCRRNGLVLDRCVGYLDAAQTRRWETLSRLTGGLLYTVFGERSRPIEIQRKVGLRQVQNRRRLPKPIAHVLAKIVGAGVAMRSGAADPLVGGTDFGGTDFGGTNSCCLVQGHRA